MNYMIKNVIESKYTTKSFEERGYDDEVQILGFCKEDLEAVIKTVVLTCADKVANPVDRKAILSLI